MQSKTKQKETHNKTNKERKKNKTIKQKTKLKQNYKRQFFKHR